MWSYWHTCLCVKIQHACKTELLLHYTVVTVYFTWQAVGVGLTLTVHNRINLVYAGEGNRWTHFHIKHTHVVWKAQWVLQGIVVFTLQWQLERALSEPPSKWTHDDHVLSVLHLPEHCNIGHWDIWMMSIWTTQFINYTPFSKLHIYLFKCWWVSRKWDSPWMRQNGAVIFERIKKKRKKKGKKTLMLFKSSV